MTNQKKLSQYQFSGFTLIEIIVVLLITSILLFVTSNFLQNLQKISNRSSPNAEERARHITWEIRDQAIIRKTTSDLQSDDFTQTHSFETLGEELVFELFYQKKWYQDFTPTKLFFRPESVMLKEPKGNSLAVINVH